MTQISKRKKARHLLVQSLYQWHMSGSALADIEAEFYVDNDMAKVDTEFFREVLHGVPKNLDVIDETYEPFLDRKLSELDPIALAVLRLGVYELLYRIDVPYRVVINEAVSLTKKFGATDSYKYVNGVLDKVAAKKRVAEVQAASGAARN